MKGVCICAMCLLCVCVMCYVVCVCVCTWCVMCVVYIWWVWQCVERRGVEVVCVRYVCVPAQTHIWKVPHHMSWQDGPSVMAMKKERVHCHCTYFSVLWVIADSCPDALMSESCSSFPAGPLKKKWCNFYSNSSTRDPFLRSLIWGWCYFAISSPILETFLIKCMIVRNIFFMKLPT